MTHGRQQHESEGQHSRWREGRNDLTAALAADLAPELEELHEQITGTGSGLDGALLAQLLSDDDCRAGSAALRARMSLFVARHRTRIRQIHRDYLGDPRRPHILDDACCLLVFEGLDRDRFSLRSRWPPTRQEAELRQLAAIWAKPIS